MNLLIYLFMCTYLRVHICTIIIIDVLFLNISPCFNFCIFLVSLCAVFEIVGLCLQ